MKWEEKNGVRDAEEMIEGGVGRESKFKYYSEVDLFEDMKV